MSAREGENPMAMKKRVAVLAAVGAMFAGITASEARLTKFTYTTKTAFNGQVFAVGTYDELRGTFSGEIDPHDRRSAVITDILLAPTNKLTNKVEYTATFTMLVPHDLGQVSGVLVYGVSNRGGRALGTGMINVTPAMPAGDGFPYNTGHVYVASGWQGDLVFDPNSPLETISVPVATGVTSKTFARFVTVSGSTQSLPGRGRTPASLDSSQSTLISIERETNVGVRTGSTSIASTYWAFADCRAPLT